MLISAKYGFAILLTPKCASSSIETMLGPYVDVSLSGLPQFRHTNYRQYEQFIKPYLQATCGDKAFETICLFREPISWLHSWYRFRARADLRAADGSETARNSTSGIPFPEFLEAYVSPEPPPYANPGDTQFDFVRNERGGVGVDTIVPYEQIDRFVEYISARVGAPLHLQIENVSPQKIYNSDRLQWASELLQNVLIRLNVDARQKDISIEKLDIPAEVYVAVKQKLADDFKVYETALAAATCGKHLADP